MRTIRTILPIFIPYLTVLMPSLCAAQTTQPVPAASWPTVAGQFTQRLLAGDRAAIGLMLADGATLRRFDGSGTGDVPALFAAISKGRLIAVHAYTQPPLAMAADLAADFKNAANLPEALRKHMIPQDDQAMKRANTVAIQWLEEVVDAKPGDQVGVAVVYVPAAREASSMGVVFVLFKADGLDGGWHVTRALYGNPVGN